MSKPSDSNQSNERSPAATRDWACHMKIALVAGGCASQTEWIAKHPGVHCWFMFHSIPSCACCGVVRRRDDSNAPCRGIVTVHLR